MLPLLGVAHLAVAADSASLEWHANLHPNLARGEAETSRLDVDGPAAVDLFHGNGMFTLPIGQTYRVNSRLSYQAVLHYNSQIWDFDLDGNASPAVLSNAGLGFDLSFGRLLAPNSGPNTTDAWVYASPDGRLHRFYSDLHWDGADPDDAADSYQYTRDSTYLRLVHQSASVKRVEFPDGTYRELRPVFGEWRVHEMGSTASSQVVAFAYGAGDATWTITDPHGRVTSLGFVTDPANSARRLLSTVDLPAFGGARAVYTLQYAQIAVPRACSDSLVGTTQASVLVGLTDPLGRTRSFTYHDQSSGCHGGGRLATAEIPSGGLVRYDYGEYTFPSLACETSAPAHLTSVSGVVQRQRVHPGGQIVGTWTYDQEHTSSCAGNEQSTVVTTPLDDRFVHYFGAGANLASAGDPGDYALPVSDITVDAGGFGTAGSDPVRMALATEVYDCALGGGGCQLVRSIWEGWRQDELCSSAGGNCFDTQRRLERQRTIFHDDGDRFRDETRSSFDGLGNYRTVRRTSNFGMADSVSWTRHWNAASDPYPVPPSSKGQLSGNWTPPSTLAPWVLTDLAYEQVVDENQRRERTDFCYDAAGLLLRSRKRGTALAPQDPVRVQTWVDGDIALRESFGGSTQALATSVDLCALPLPAQPVAQQLETRVAGAVAVRQWLEPDGTPIAHRTVDDTIDPSTGLVAIGRTVAGLETEYLYDLLGRRTWSRPEAGQGAWLEIRYMPPNPSLPGGWAGPSRQMRRYPNGQSAGTLLDYDVELDDVFGDRYLEHHWVDGTGQSRRRYFQHDPLGNRRAESTLHYTGDTFGWKYRLDYDPFGRAGRLRPFEGPDNDVTLEFFGERRVVRTEGSRRAWNIGTQECINGIATTETTFDGQGRFWKSRFERNQPAPGELVEVEQQYQPDGTPRLREERRTVNSSTRIERVSRSFDDYGNLLRSDTETGIAPSPRLLLTVLYGSHDARGKALVQTRIDDFNPSPGISIAASYDAAGRLVSITDAADPSRPWKEIVYGQDNGPVDSEGRADYRLGKVVRTVRHNYAEVLTVAHHEVEETLAYRGIGGRISEVETSVSTVQSASVELQIARSYRATAQYDDLGYLVEMGYPACVGCGAGEPSEVRTVSRTYDWLGRLTSVGGALGAEPQDWVDQVDWLANDQLETVVHDNGVRDEFTADPDGHRRASRVRIQWNTDTHFDSGTLGYDGRGELCGRGQQPVLGIPDEPEELLPGPVDCLASQVTDPFGGWNGEVSVAACRFDQGIQPYVLYDASDRVFAVIDLGKVKKVYTASGPEWVRDPDNYTHTFTLYGIDGSLQRKVESHYQGAWRETRDQVHAFGRVVGQSKVVDEAPTYVDRIHRHPLMQGYTNWRGWLRTTAW